MKAFCDQRNIPADDITLSLDHEVDAATHLINRMIIEIIVPLDFPEKYDAAVINAASVCTVKRHLNPEIQHLITVKRK